MSNDNQHIESSFLLTSTPKKMFECNEIQQSSNCDKKQTKETPNLSSIEWEQEDSVSVETETNSTIPIRTNMHSSVSNNSNVKVDASSLSEIPISPRLKNRVRQRLYNLINTIDGFKPSELKSNQPTQQSNAPDTKSSNSVHNFKINQNYLNANKTADNFSSFQLKMLQSLGPNNKLSDVNRDLILYKNHGEKSSIVSSGDCDVSNNSTYVSSVEIYKAALEECFKVKSIDHLNNLY